jgi:hypothetical protein
LRLYEAGFKPPMARLFDVSQLAALAAALVALRLAGHVARRWRVRRSPELAAWCGGLASYAVACAALAWAAAAGWDDRVFKVYYLFGGLLSAPLLGVGSLLLAGKRWAAPAGSLWVGLAAGVVVAEPLVRRVHGTAIPAAQEHFDWFPARMLAVIGNSVGTVAVIAVALMTFARRPLGNLLLMAGIGVAAIGSALVGLGAGGTAVVFALAVVLLYAGFTSHSAQGLLTLRRGTRLIR